MDPFRISQNGKVWMTSLLILLLFLGQSVLSSEVYSGRKITRRQLSSEKVTPNASVIRDNEDEGDHRASRRESSIQAAGYDGSVGNDNFQVPKSLCSACEKFPWTPVAGAENVRNVPAQRHPSAIQDGTGPEGGGVGSALTGGSGGGYDLESNNRQPFAIQQQGQGGSEGQNAIQSSPLSSQAVVQGERPILSQNHGFGPQRPTVLQPVNPVILPQYSRPGSGPQQSIFHNFLGRLENGQRQLGSPQALYRPTVLQPVGEGNAYGPSPPHRPVNAASLPQSPVLGNGQQQSQFLRQHNPLSQPQSLVSFSVFQEQPQQQQQQQQLQLSGQQQPPQPGLQIQGVESAQLIYQEHSRLPGQSQGSQGQYGPPLQPRRPGFGLPPLQNSRIPIIPRPFSGRPWNPFRFPGRLSFPNAPNLSGSQGVPIGLPNRRPQPGQPVLAVEGDSQNSQKYNSPNTIVVQSSYSFPPHSTEEIQTGPSQGGSGSGVQNVGQQSGPTAPDALFPPPIVVETGPLQPPKDHNVPQQPQKRPQNSAPPQYTPFPQLQYPPLLPAPQQNDHSPISQHQNIQFKPQENSLIHPRPPQGTVFPPQQNPPFPQPEQQNQDIAPFPSSEYSPQSPPSFEFLPSQPASNDVRAPQPAGQYLPPLPPAQTGPSPSVNQQQTLPHVQNAPAPPPLVPYAAAVIGNQVLLGHGNELPPPPQKLPQEHYVVPPHNQPLAALPEQNLQFNQPPQTQQSEFSGQNPLPAQPFIDMKPPLPPPQAVRPLLLHAGPLSSPQLPRRPVGYALFPREPSPQFVSPAPTGPPVSQPAEQQALSPPQSQDNTQVFVQSVPLQQTFYVQSGQHSQSSDSGISSDNLVHNQQQLDPSDHVVQQMIQMQPPGEVPIIPPQNSQVNFAPQVIESGSFQSFPVRPLPSPPAPSYDPSQPVQSVQVAAFEASLLPETLPLATPELSAVDNAAQKVIQPPPSHGLKNVAVIPTTTPSPYHVEVLGQIRKPGSSNTEYIPAGDVGTQSSDESSGEDSTRIISSNSNINQQQQIIASQGNFLLSPQIVQFSPKVTAVPERQGAQGMDQVQFTLQAGDTNKHQGETRPKVIGNDKWEIIPATQYDISHLFNNNPSAPSKNASDEPLPQPSVPFSAQYGEYNQEFPTSPEYVTAAADSQSSDGINTEADDSVEEAPSNPSPSVAPPESEGPFSVGIPIVEPTAESLEANRFDPMPQSVVNALHHAQRTSFLTHTHLGDQDSAQGTVYVESVPVVQGDTTGNSSQPKILEQSQKEQQRQQQPQGVVVTNALRVEGASPGATVITPFNCSGSHMALEVGDDGQTVVRAYPVKTHPSVFYYPTPQSSVYWAEQSSSQPSAAPHPEDIPAQTLNAHDGFESQREVTDGLFSSPIFGWSPQVVETSNHVGPQDIEDRDAGGNAGSVRDDEKQEVYGTIAKGSITPYAASSSDHTLPSGSIESSGTTRHNESDSTTIRPSIFSRRPFFGRPSYFRPGISSSSGTTTVVAELETSARPDYPTKTIPKPTVSQDGNAIQPFSRLKMPKAITSSRLDSMSSTTVAVSTPTEMPAAAISSAFETQTMATLYVPSDLPKKTFGKTEKPDKIRLSVGTRYNAAGLTVSFDENLSSQAHSSRDVVATSRPPTVLPPLDRQITSPRTHASSEDPDSMFAGPTDATPLGFSKYGDRMRQRQHLQQTQPQLHTSTTDQPGRHHSSAPLNSLAEDSDSGKISAVAAGGRKRAPVAANILSTEVAAALDSRNSLLPSRGISFERPFFSNTYTGSSLTTDNEKSLESTSTTSPRMVTKVVKTVRVRQRMTPGGSNGPRRHRFTGRVRVVQRQPLSVLGEDRGKEKNENSTDESSAIPEGDPLAKEEEAEVQNAIIDLKKIST